MFAGHVRYRIRVVRVQHVERVVTATSEETALERIRAEIDRPYGILASWITDDFTVEVLEVEHPHTGGGTGPTDGPLLLSVKAAAEQLGISRAVLYEMMHRGDRECANRPADAHQPRSPSPVH